MATEKTKATNLRIKSDYPITVYEYVVEAGADCEPVEVNPAAVCSVQVEGDFDNGHVDILGSLSGKAFVYVTDKAGFGVSLSEASVKTLGQAVRLIKPDVLVGERGKVSITIMTGGAV